MALCCAHTGDQPIERVTTDTMARTHRIGRTWHLGRPLVKAVRLRVGRVGKASTGEQRSGLANVRGRAYALAAMARHRPLLLLLTLIAGLGPGCSPQIGDECSTSIDCSVDGDRICDLAQPGGYCTVRGCDLGTCPEESVSVEWLGSVPRTADNWCMLRCEGDSDCRTDVGYACVRADDPRLRDADGAPIASIFEVDSDGDRFCAAVN